MTHSFDVPGGAAAAATVTVRRACGSQCSRCWKVVSVDGDTLCGRCKAVRRNKRHLRFE